MNKINAAVVGAGIYGKHHINAYHYNPQKPTRFTHGL